MQDDRAAETAKQVNDATNEALLMLEQAFAYYMPEAVIGNKRPEYYEYVPAA